MAVYFVYRSGHLRPTNVLVRQFEARLAQLPSIGGLKRAER